MVCTYIYVYILNVHMPLYFVHVHGLTHSISLGDMLTKFSRFGIIHNNLILEGGERTHAMNIHVWKYKWKAKQS